MDLQRRDFLIGTSILVSSQIFVANTATSPSQASTGHSLEVDQRAKWKSPHFDSGDTRFNPDATVKEQITAIWDFEDPRGFGHPIFSDGKLFVSSSGGNEQNSTLYAINPTDGSQEWTFQVDQFQMSDPIINGNFVYIATFPRVYAIDVNTGLEVWRSEDFNSNPRPVHLVQNDVVVFDVDQTVHAFNSETGDVVWRKEFEDLEADYDALGVIDVVGSSSSMHILGQHTTNNRVEYTIETLNVEDGSTRWTQYITERGENDPIAVRRIISTDESLFVPIGPSSTRFEDGGVIALSRSNGSTTWEYESRSEMGGMDVMAVSDDILYISDFVEMVALDKLDGDFLWEFDPVGGPSNVAATKEGLCLTDPRYLYGISFDREDKIELWNFHFDGESVEGGPLIVDNFVCVATDSRLSFFETYEDEPVTTTPASAPSSTPTPTLTDESTPLPTLTPTPTSEPMLMPTPEPEEELQRGFFTNNGDPGLDFLKEPGNLSAVGFVLSIAGILLQLLRED